MDKPADHDQKRRTYERQVDALVGRSVHGVTYYDIHLYGEPRTWDYGSWHHAVMGVEFAMDTGPVSAIWTNTFYPYGIEVFDAPMSTHLLRLNEPDGPEVWDVSAHDDWVQRRGSPIQAVSTFWETLTFTSPPLQPVDVPVAMRWDFAAGPVWLVVGTPKWPDVEDVFIPGDEVLVVFTEERMRRIGFPDGEFVGS